MRRARSGLTIVAIVTAVLLVAAACNGSASKNKAGSTQTGFGTLPAQSGTPSSGGTVAYGMPPGDTPTYIFPILPAAQTTVYTSRQFQYLMWRPLYWPRTGSAPVYDIARSLASPATFSNGNKTVTVHLDTTYKWSDGKPVDAQDVIFATDVTKAAVKESAANWGNYTPGLFPDNVVSTTAPDPYTVVFTLDRPYNPQWFYLDQLGLIIPMPHTSWAKDAANGPQLDYTNPANAKKIYDFLNAESSKPATYTSNPLWQDVDGPFHLTAFDASTGANSMAPNTSYTGPDPAHIARLDEVAFTSNTAEFNQLRSGGLTAGPVPADDVPQIPQLQRAGYNVYGYPDFGWFDMIFNFKDTTGHWNSMVAQPYIRQALAHLVDQPGYIKGIYRGAADPAYGPVPAHPVSPYTPANAVTAQYPYSVATAKSLLTSHGWHVAPNGTTTCATPGTGPNQCGAGIPAGTALSFNLIYNSGSAPIVSETTAFASSAKQAGVNITLVGKTFNFILQNYNDVGAPANNNQWAMEDYGGFSPQTYPTTNTNFNTSGTFNNGGYSNPTADKLIHDSVFGGDPAAVKAEASFLTSDLPALFQPNRDQIYAWKNTMSGPPDSFATMTQYFLQPEDWYFKK